MFESTKKMWATGSLLVAACVAGPSLAADAELRAEVEQLRAEMAQLRAEQGETWLNERRAEEVKGLIREVLADADTRSTLLEDGVLAGHDGKFFLKSADGNYLLNVTGQFQFRYIFGLQGDNGVDSDDSDSHDSESSDHGFQLRRLKIGFAGHAVVPELEYKFVVVTNRDGGDAQWDDDAYISYDMSEFVDGLSITAGNQKVPFLREELISSSRQLAVDRSSATELLTANRALGIKLDWKNDFIALAGMFHAGADTNIIDYNNASHADVGLAGRVDVNVLGTSWKNARDIAAWEGTETSLFLGGALLYQDGPDSTGADTDAEWIAWTVDGLFKTGPFSFMAAYQQGTLVDADTDNTSGNPFSVVAQGGVFLIPDKFQPYVRYEYLDFDAENGSGDDIPSISLISAGFNYYIKKHNLKFTADAVYAVCGPNEDDYDSATFADNFNNNGAFSDSLGFGGFSGEGQVVFRSQVQLTF